jgi:hypothetical protein
MYKFHKVDQGLNPGMEEEAKPAGIWIYNGSLAPEREFSFNHSKDHEVLVEKTDIATERTYLTHAADLNKFGKLTPVLCTEITMFAP